jgi:DNA-binding SARP family transcriptional activator
MGTHVYLCGRLAITGQGVTIDERELPGRQGRIVLALLCVEPGRPISIERLHQALWGDDVPLEAAGAVASIVSKLRTLLRSVGAGTDPISAGSGNYQIRLPAGTSIDLEDARNAIDRAEGARRRGDEAAAWADATVAVAIARRGFLTGETAGWVVFVQRELERLARRGYDCLTWVWTQRNNGVLAVAMAELAVEVAPLHEPAWRTLISTNAQFGSRADALSAYWRCFHVMRDQLGIAPDTETSDLYQRLNAT